MVVDSGDLDQARQEEIPNGTMLVVDMDA